MQQKQAEESRPDLCDINRKTTFPLPSQKYIKDESQVNDGVIIKEEDMKWKAHKLAQWSKVD